MKQNYDTGAPSRRPDLKRKLVVVGDGGMRPQSLSYSLYDSNGITDRFVGCGKTCLLTVYAENRFPEVCAFPGQSCCDA